LVCFLSPDAHLICSLFVVGFLLVFSSQMFVVAVCSGDWKQAAGPTTTTTAKTTVV
jgi:hypothetical protein